MSYVKVSVCFAIILLVTMPVSNSFALSEESQRILNKYQEYKESNYAPTPNKKPTNTPPNQNSKSSSQSPQVVPNMNIGSNQIVIVIFVILLIVAVAFAGTRSKEWGSWDHPPSMKQLAWLRNRGYSGRMPTSSRDAHKIISDIRKGGDGDYEREDYDD